MKSFKAKGKRLTNFVFGDIEEIEPRPGAEPDEELPENDGPDGGDDNGGGDGQDAPDNPEDDMSDEEIRDSIIGQERLF